MSRALYIACQNGHDDIVLYMISNSNSNPNPNYLCSTALVIAFSFGNINIVLLILKLHSSDVKNQALIDVARNENVELLKLLLADPSVDPVKINCPIATSSRHR